jgi:hypothetical protein
MTKDEALRMVLKNLKIIEAQDQGCGGNVTEAEAWRSAKRIAWHTINFCEEALETKEGLLDRKSYLLGLYDQKSRIGLETKDEPVALQYPQKDIDWQREQQIKAQGSTTPQRTWVGLDTDEFKFIASKYLLNREVGLEYFQEEIESKLKEKNT